MTMTATPVSIPAPASDEYAPFYSGYVAGVKGADILRVLERQMPRIGKACSRLSEVDALARYAPGKWSIKEVIGHMTDAERIFAYRALRISRADTTPLASFDENAYVAAANFDSRSMSDLLVDLEAVRASTIRLLQSLAPEAWGRRGVASTHAVSVRALAHIIAGHAQHHMRVLEERYGLSLDAAGALSA
jgi:uncharacterized damage-inducible protein DinB